MQSSASVTPSYLGGPSAPAEPPAAAANTAPQTIYKSGTVVPLQRVLRDLAEAPKVHGDPMPSSEDVMKEMVAASDARTDTKIVQVERKFDLAIAGVQNKLDLVIEGVRASREEARENQRTVIANARDNRRALIANGWVIFGAAIAIIGVLYTVAPAIFDLGVKYRETITRDVQEQLRTRPSGSE